MKQTLQKLATLAKADIVVENFPEGDDARGFYANGVIHLNARTLQDYAWAYVAIHEAVHHLKANNVQGYSVLEKYITNYLSRKGRNVDNMVKALQRSRAKHNEKLSYEDALEELVCNALSDIATDENAMSAFLELNESERKTLISVLRDIAQKIRDWAKSLTGKEYRRLVTESEVLRHLANELNKQLKSVEGNTQMQREVRKNAYNDVTAEDIAVLRSIGRKSVNSFTSEDIEKAEFWSRKFYRELGTKSPFFRAWYGDWRAYDKTKIIFANKKSATRFLHKNIDTGWEIRVSAPVFNETKSHKSVVARKAVEYLDFIDDIVKCAVLLDTSIMSPKKSDNSLFMHSMYAIADIGNGPVLLKLYVEEMNNPNANDTSKRTYMLQKIENQQLSVKGSHLSVSPIISTADVITIADLHALVKQYDKKFAPKPVNPVLLNQDGTPMVLYHGTSDSFTEFRYEELSSVEGSFFFAQNREDAEAYSSNGTVMEVYVKLNNPIDYNNMPSEIYKLKDKRAQVEALKELGYDGWYCDMEDGWGEVSAFYPEQIKSATDNIGTFDGSKKDIRYSYADMVDLSADYDNAVEEYLRHKSRYNLNKVREIVNLAASKAMPDSVVRDESGLLTKVYHGTEAESFNVFDKKRRGQTDSSLWGRGYYFTPDLEFATDFGENVRGFYLNIINPFVVTKVDAPASTIAVKFKSLGIPVNFDYSKIKAFEFAGAFGNQRFTDVLMEHGYDGVIVEDFEFVAFDQNQMKLADAITYDDNGDVIPLSERFDSGTNDIRYSRNDFSVDYSDLSVLDDEQIDAYNKRGWARGLFTSEDIALLNRRLGEIYHENSQYVRTTLADGTVVLDLNNKVLLTGGTLESPVIYSVMAINAINETDSEFVKEDIQFELHNTRFNKETFTAFLESAQFIYGEESIRVFNRRNYIHIKGRIDEGNRASLPDDWQNYGYTTGKQNGRRFSAGPEGGVPGTGRIRPDKRKNSYGDEDFNLWGLLDPEEETPETTERSELLEGFVQTAGTLLEKTRSIPLEDGRIRRIAIITKRKSAQTLPMSKSPAHTPEAEVSQTSDISISCRKINVNKAVIFVYLNSHNF